MGRVGNLPTRPPWWGPMRGPFLLLTPACTALALACAWLTRPVAMSATSFVIEAGLALVAALSAHISVNALNEYVDFRSGLDAMTQRTPFSGGSGTLQAHPGLVTWTLILGLGTLVLSLALGLDLLAYWPTTWARLAPLGLLGLALVAGYSPWIARRPWLCLIAPGLGFGTVMVAGAACALVGRHTALAWWAAGVPFLLVNNLLLLNQFPDVDADRAVGRQTLPIVLGRPTSARVAQAQWALAYGLIVVGVLAQVLPPGALLGCLTAPLAWKTGRGVRQHADDLPALVSHLGANVAITLLTPVLMAAGMLLG
jgi:1,4-dihydroxy-2-naphthoate octaprenyltransferase